MLYCDAASTYIFQDTFYRWHGLVGNIFCFMFFVKVRKQVLTTYCTKNDYIDLYLTLIRWYPQRAFEKLALRSICYNQANLLAPALTILKAMSLKLLFIRQTPQVEILQQQEICNTHSKKYLHMK